MAENKGAESIKTDSDGQQKDGKVDKQLEHQREVVKELGRDPDAAHPGEVPSAPLTEHGETSGLKPLVDDLHERRAKIKLGGCLLYTSPSPRDS